MHFLPYAKVFVGPRGYPMSTSFGPKEVLIGYPLRVSQEVDMSQPLEPLQQATITIAGCDLQAVLLPDGQPAIVFAALCEALALKPSSQAQHIRAHPVLIEALASARLETAGGSQIANVLIAWGIPLWLAGIRIASVKPNARQRLIIFQKEIVALLYGRFFSAATAAIPEPQPAASPWQALHATYSPWKPRSMPTHRPCWSA